MSVFSIIILALIVALSAATAVDRINDLIATNKAVIFSKSYCPYCKNTKKLFSQMRLPATVVELDQEEDGKEIQAALLAKTGQRTVPNVFVSGQHVGGNDDTVKAGESGLLMELWGMKY